MHHVNTFLTLALWAAPTHKAIAVFFCSLQDRGDLRPAVCELRSFYGAPLAMTSPVTLVAPFFVSAWAQASKVAPVVKMSSQRCPYLIQSNDSQNFEHPVCMLKKIGGY